MQDQYHTNGVAMAKVWTMDKTEIMTTIMGMDKTVGAGWHKSFRIASVKLS